MTTYTLWPTGAPPFRFKGELVADASTSMERASPNYSGKAGRCEDIEIYRHDNGGFVVNVLYRTAFQGCDNHRVVTICPTAVEVLAALDGIRSRIVDELVDEADITYEDYYPVHQKSAQ
ncbi:hypothetical protein D3875_00645 [Deinococcus cavernae]|uniref:Uncharacterized protein n=1 Tax=Deinococcus cavernae TaxID=2320857 RepID=A0A418VHR6_9DEIO|nr:hypothetical protein [Deinococcus cavernae]RJF75590.1 hypothetical protein D3875_00645 [Deinococcus cavernae]